MPLPTNSTSNTVAHVELGTPTDVAIQPDPALVARLFGHAEGPDSASEGRPAKTHRPCFASKTPPIFCPTLYRYQRAPAFEGATPRWIDRGVSDDQLRRLHCDVRPGRG